MSKLLSLIEILAAEDSKCLDYIILCFNSLLILGALNWEAWEF
jgi:hypothetical protein